MDRPFHIKIKDLQKQLNGNGKSSVTIPIDLEREWKGLTLEEQTSELMTKK